MSSHLESLINRFDQRRILVLGDLMLDEYLWGKVTRISPEAPIPVVDVEATTFAPGGAANVATNIVALGGKALLCGLIGDDETGKQLQRELEKWGIQSQFLLDPNRRTTLKTRVVAHSQQVVRVDRESRLSLSKKLAQDLLRLVKENLDSVEALLISDYGKGTTVPSLMQGVITAADEAGKMVLIDPKGTDYRKYKGATIITPNEKEAEEAVGKRIVDDFSLAYAMKTILRRLECRAILVTRGEKGLSLLEANGGITHLPTFARQVYDVTGAGDTVVGTLALALTSGASFPEAAALANYAAGIVVGRVGTAAVTPRELKGAIAEREDDG